MKSKQGRVKAGRPSKGSKVLLNTRVTEATKHRLTEYCGADRIMCEVVELAVNQHIDRGGKP